MWRRTWTLRAEMDTMLKKPAAGAFQRPSEPSASRHWPSSASAVACLLFWHRVGKLAVRRAPPGQPGQRGKFFLSSGHVWLIVSWRGHNGVRFVLVTWESGQHQRWREKAQVQAVVVSTATGCPLKSRIRRLP